MRLGFEIFDEVDLFKDTAKRYGSGLQHDSVLVNASGMGKTALLFRIASGFYSVFMDCAGAGGLPDDPTKDVNYSVMLAEINKGWKVDSTVPADLHALRNVADERIFLEFTARWLLLKLLAIQRADVLSPTAFLLCQLNGGQGVIATIISRLRHESHEDIREVAIELMNDLSATVLSLPTCKNNGRPLHAFDEANVGYKQMHGAFRNGTGEVERGLMTPILGVHRVFPGQPSSITAGTALSLGKADSVASDVGKKGTVHLLSDLPALDEAAVVDSLERCLNLDGCNVCMAPQFHLLVGRPRLAARIMDLITDNASKMTASKQSVLDDAIAKSVEQHRERLRQRLEAEVRKGPLAILGGNAPLLIRPTTMLFPYIRSMPLLRTKCAHSPVVARS